MKFSIKLTFTVKSGRPKAFDATWRTPVLLQLFLKYTWSCCRCSLNVSMYGTVLDASLHASDRQCEAHAPGTILHLSGNSIMRSCFNRANTYINVHTNNVHYYDDNWCVARWVTAAPSVPSPDSLCVGMFFFWSTPLITATMVFALHLAPWHTDL